jgi:hypothetical protein
MSRTDYRTLDIISIHNPYFRGKTHWNEQHVNTLHSHFLVTQAILNLHTLYAHWPWSRLSLEQRCVPGIFHGSKDGRCVVLATLPSSCTDCLEIWEPQAPGALRTCKGTTATYSLPNFILSRYNSFTSTRLCKPSHDTRQIIGPAAANKMSVPNSKHTSTKKLRSSVKLRAAGRYLVTADPTKHRSCLQRPFYMSTQLAVNNYQPTRRNITEEWSLD